MKIRKIKKKSKILVKAKIIAEQVELNREEYSKLSIEDLKIRTDYLVEGLANNKFSLNDIVVDAFSIAREIIYRTHGLYAFPVQIMGAYVVHCGDFAEMYTGEGKTLTILLVSFLNALAKRGVHIVTVNEYLVERDAEFSRIAFEQLGITVGYNTSKLSKEAKKEMFAKDITYTTNSELGFDYLRDNMVRSIEEKVIRDLFFVIIDEADSVLIDEARTPLIISGQPKEDFSLFLDVDNFVKSISKDDYAIDAESNTISLTESGIAKAEKFFNLPNLYSVESAEIVHKITNGLIANYIFANGKEYLVKEDKIYLVDSFTGRILEGRSYNAGLQQAIQAKERVKIEPENVVMATIIYQSFFRLYERLSGVSGTAMTDAEEFLKIYNMVVVKVPTNRPIQRIDHLDSIFGTKKAKWERVINEIVERHNKGQPVLVGTASVNDSELIHERLTKLNIPHEVLNARDNSREAQIVKNAGQIGAVTISTNMAGRGTDIKVSDEAKKLGGLYVIGTERHESRRIDNQLRGRTGRQGDPGESRFFISLEDTLFQRYANEKIAKASQKLEEDEDPTQDVKSSFFTKMLNWTQKKVEGLNFDIRKNLMDYDHVLSLQRELIYKQRDQILLKTNSLKIITNMAKEYSQIVALSHVNKENSAIVDAKEISDFVNTNILKFEYFKVEDFDGLTISLAADKIFEIINLVINAKYQILQEINSLDSLSELLLVNLDQKWITHIDKMIKLREGVHLRSLEQRSPLNIYIEDGDNLFEKMKNDVVRDVILGLCKFSLPHEQDKLRDALSEFTKKGGFKKKVNSQPEEQLTDNLENQEVLSDNPIDLNSQEEVLTNHEILEEPFNFDAQKEMLDQQTPHEVVSNSLNDELHEDVVIEVNQEQTKEANDNQNDNNEEAPLTIGSYINAMIEKYSKQNQSQQDDSNDIDVKDNQIIDQENEVDNSIENDNLIEEDQQQDEENNLFSSNDLNQIIEENHEPTNDVVVDNQDEQIIEVEDNLDEKINNNESELEKVFENIFEQENNQNQEPQDLNQQQEVKQPQTNGLDFYKLPNVAPKPIGKLFDSNKNINKFENQLIEDFKNENEQPIDDVVEKVEEVVEQLVQEPVSFEQPSEEPKTFEQQETLESFVFGDDDNSRMERIKKEQEEKEKPLETNYFDFIDNDEIIIPLDEKGQAIKGDDLLSKAFDSVEKIENDNPTSTAHFINENYDIEKVNEKADEQLNQVKEEKNHQSEEPKKDEPIIDEKLLNRLKVKVIKDEIEKEIINEIKNNKTNQQPSRKSSFDEQIISLIWNKAKK